MKKAFKIINTLLGVFFVAGIIWYVLYIHSLPSSMYVNLNTHNLLIPSYLLLACGLLSFIVSQALISSVHAYEVVYVDRIVKPQVEMKEEEEAVTETGNDGDLLQKLQLVIRKEEEDSKSKMEKILNFLCDQLKAGQGIIYKTAQEKDKLILHSFVTYAFSKDKNESLDFELGEGLPGLAAKENKLMLLDNIPKGYITVFSGLGSSSPSHLLIVPLTNNEKVTGVLELALFEKPKVNPNVFFKEISSELGKLLAAI